jgi:TPR repeat protein
MKKLLITIFLFLMTTTYLNASSEYTKGFMLYKKGHKLLKVDSEKSFMLFKQAEPHLISAYKSNSARSAFMLGRMYCNGWGVSQNFKIAEKYFKVAISLGDKRSNCCLSRLHLMFLKDNIQEGEKYFKVAKKYNIKDCKDISAYIKQHNLFYIED